MESFVRNLRPDAQEWFLLRVRIGPTSPEVILDQILAHPQLNVSLPVWGDKPPLTAASEVTVSGFPLGKAKALLQKLLASEKFDVPSRIEALKVAIFNKYTDAIQLLAEDPSVALEAYPAGPSSIFDAVQERDYGMVTYFIARGGSDVNYTSPRGETALGLAVERGDAKMFERLFADVRLDVDAPHVIVAEGGALMTGSVRTRVPLKAHRDC